jgi:hypothetical protein
MEKQILLEIKRIQNLMNNISLNGTLILEDAQGQEISQRRLDMQNLNQDTKGGGDPSGMRYVNITLGPQSTQPYPIMFDYPNGLPIMGDKITGEPRVWKFKEGMSSKTFISPKNQTILVGSVKSVDGKIKKNQEYFEKNGLK